MTRWSVTHSYIAGAPSHIDARDNAHLVEQVQALADAKCITRSRPPIGELRVEMYTDEAHFFFTHASSGKQTRFMNVQCEGPTP